LNSKECADYQKPQLFGKKLWTVYFKTDMLVTTYFYKTIQ